MGKVVYIEKFNNTGGRTMKNNNIIRYDKQTIELMAHDVLESYDICELPVDPISIAHKLGVKVFERSFNPFNGDTVSGAIRKDEENNISIFVNKSDSYERQRFTIAHELGHYFMHLQDSKDFEKVDMHRATGYTTHMPQEVDANNFAAALLMDKNTLIEKFNLVKSLKFSDYRCIEYLSNMFGVSKSAMQYRLMNLGLL